MYKKGIIIGKFAPLTLGHINLINHASTFCEQLLIIISYDDKFLKEQSSYMQKRMTLQKRKRWLTHIYKDLKHIHIAFINESEIASYPDGWKDYVDLLLDLFKEKDFIPEVIFSSAIEDYIPYEKWLPNFKHIVIEESKTLVPYSSEEMRENIYTHWEYLPSIVRKDFTKTVCIIGTESCGKTTLTKYLAKLYNTSWVEEYGRVFCEEELNMDESLLESKDYETIAIEQKQREIQALRLANKVMFVDTNAFVTQYYHRLYMGFDNALVEAIAREENYDLILFLRSDVPWVDDGLRVNNNRQKTDAFINRMLLDYNLTNKVKYIYGTYNERLKKANQLVEDVFKDIH